MFQLSCRNVVIVSKHPIYIQVTYYVDKIVTKEKVEQVLDILVA